MPTVESITSSIDDIMNSQPSYAEVLSTATSKKPDMMFGGDLSQMDKDLIFEGLLPKKGFNILVYRLYSVLMVYSIINT